MRITAQLVDARNGFQLRSETCDRDVSDVFAVQELRIKVSAGPQGALAKQETSDPEAHALLLRGIAAVADATIRR